LKEESPHHYLDFKSFALLQHIWWYIRRNSKCFFVIIRDGWFKWNFEGPILMSIFKLKRCLLLQISKNNFNGTIQLDVIGRLQNLSTLDLVYNTLFIDATSIRHCHEASSSFPNFKCLWVYSCYLREYLKYKSSLQFLAIP